MPDTTRPPEWTVSELNPGETIPETCCQDSPQAGWGDEEAE